MKNKKKVAHKITGAISIVQIVVFAVLYLFVSSMVTKNIQENTIDSMQTIVEDRSKLIENYVHETESYLTAYSRAGEIKQLLLNPADEDAVVSAQKYTEVYSSDIEHLEGIYVSEWDAHVLAHTNAAVVGITTREGDSLKKLQESMIAAEGVYNVGIIFSPASGQQIISMYRACMDSNGQPAGLVGAGIYISGLKETLDRLPNAGLSQAKYYLINTQTGEYIFHEDSEMCGKVAQEEFVQGILSKLKQKGTGTDYIEYDEDGEHYIAAYHNISERGWMFLLSDTTDEVFATVRTIKIQMIIFCAIAVILLIGISNIIISVSTKPLSPITTTLCRIADCDIRDDGNVRGFIGRNDDLGEIANASYNVIESLNSIVSTLKQCCTRLNEKAVNLKSSSADLVDCVSDNIATTQQLSASLESVDSANVSIHDEIGSMYNAIDEIAANLRHSSEFGEHMFAEAAEMKESANISFGNTQEKVETEKSSVKNALDSLNNLSQINGMAAEILEIANQTNLLSINASIEAARSGQMGKGFAVVAEEIGGLAETSKRTAAKIRELCQSSNNSIREVNDCVGRMMHYMENDVLQSFGDFAEKSNEYSSSVEMIKQDIEKLNAFVGNLKLSIGQIYDNTMDVRRVSEQNSSAINEIVKKSERTADIADAVRIQSDENRLMADDLENIVDEFTC